MSSDFLGISPKKYCASLNDLAWLCNRRNLYSRLSVAQCKWTLVRKGRRRRRRRRRNITVDNDNDDYYYYYYYYYSKLIFKFKWLLLYVAPH
jgi:hypothetical protein